MLMTSVNKASNWNNIYCGNLACVGDEHTIKIEIEIVRDRRCEMAVAQVTARSCGDCMMCCKLLSIEELEKPAGIWCRHARSGQGCGIYKDRPNACSHFLCEWMTNPNLGQNWKPTSAKFVIFTSSIDQSLNICPDTGYPNAWRQEPYYSVLKETAARLIEQKKITRVTVGEMNTVLLPDRDEVVRCRPGSQITVIVTNSSAGTRYDLKVEPPLTHR